jgi:thioredoxin-dependent peroxiredoxin
MQIGDSIPEFRLPASGGSEMSNADLRGRWVVLYFYPKDLTPGCTTEAINFSDSLDHFEKRNALVLGVSKDSVASHDKFISKHDLRFPLLSDANGELCEAFGCWVEKSMYGKTYMGIDRSTFLISPDGKIVEIWRKVKVKGHVESVLDALEKADNQAE